MSYFWRCWTFIAVRGFSLVVASRGYSLVAACRLLTLVALLVAEQGCSEHVGFSSCGVWALEYRLQ